MRWISATTRIAFALACLCVAIVLTAAWIGLVPDSWRVKAESRASGCEAVALGCSTMASKGDSAGLKVTLTNLVQRNPDILSAAVRRANGEVLVEVGDHLSHWSLGLDDISTENELFVPLFRGSEPWGTVELRYKLLRPDDAFGKLQSPMNRTIAFIGTASFLVFLVFLRRVLRHLDPSKVVPSRVRSAMDILAEGLLVLDRNERIVLANEALARTVERSSEELQGQSVSTLPWVRGDDDGDLTEMTFPWTTTIATGRPGRGAMIMLRTRGDQTRSFIVNSAPVFGDDGKPRGVLASFDDVTLLEQEKAELGEALRMLKHSREEIRRQNQELQILATRDPLTGCLNRRSFFEQAEPLWKAAVRYGHPISGFMVDIDHFKAVNDNHGHAAGDEVLREIAGVLRREARDSDLPCRYGGEEFCFLLPHTNIDEAAQAAERILQAIRDTKIGELSVTASIGVSEMVLGAQSIQDLLEQADKCLYVAKGGGRDQVVRWDHVPDDVEVDETKISRVPEEEVDDRVAIPYHAVMALLSALFYRDPLTARHSIRVADYCVRASRRVLPPGEIYILEIAGLLHDVGKIGMPDSILLKVGKLTQEEWAVMRTHEHISADIVNSAFASDELVEIIRNHHMSYSDDPGRLPGATVPEASVASRILSIADAFDAMTSDRIYRAGRTMAEAFRELRRNAGIQFDAELVDTFIAAIQADDRHRHAEFDDVARDTALSVGQEIENLAIALDQKHVPTLAGLAGRLKMTAKKHQVVPIAEAAERLEELATGDSELSALVQQTNELLEMCRDIQRAYLDQRPEKTDA